MALVDGSAAAGPVIETAVRVGEMAGVPVRALHWAGPEGASRPTEWAASRSGVPLEVRGGPVQAGMLGSVRDAHVVAAVIGARSAWLGRRPLGATARRFVEQTDKPVVVVPPGIAPPEPIRRLLVPLEGREDASRAVLGALSPLVAGPVDLVVLHVWTGDTCPPMLDRPEYDLDVLGREFLRRHFPRTDRIELRPGPVGRQILEVSAAQGCDLVVLSWSQESAGDRAPVVREVLAGCPLPVLLLPEPGAGNGEVARPGAGRASSRGPSALPDGGAARP